MDTKTFTLRLNSEHMEVLERKAKENGMTKNAYIRSILNLVSSEDKQDKILEELETIKQILSDK